jgi:hypothetical protein
MLIRQNGSVSLLTTTTQGTVGAWVKCYGPDQSYQAVAVGTAGAFTCTVTIQGSNDGVNPVATALGTITANGTGPTASSDGFTTGLAPWAWIRATATTLTGTGATVTVLMGC